MIHQKTILNITALLVLAAGAVRASDILNPRSYCSRSGGFTLYVDPSQPSGSGNATCRLMKGDATVWSATLPVTLWDAAVTRSGLVVGFGYTHGKHGLGEDGMGDFVVALIDKTGSVVLNEHHRRQRSLLATLIPPSPTPIGYGLLLDEASDRFVVRMADDDNTRRDEIWSVYSLSNARLLGRFHPLWSIDDARDNGCITGALALADTPLALVRLSVGGCHRHQCRDGAIFALLELDGNVVWTLDTISEATLQKAQGGSESAPAGGRHREIGTPRCDSEFVIRLGTQGQLTASVKKTETGRWNVPRLTYTSNVIRADVNPHPQVAVGDVCVLKYIGALFLEDVPHKSSRLKGEDVALNAVSAVEATANNIFALDARTNHIRVFNEAGKLLYVCRALETDRDETAVDPQLSVNSRGDLFVDIGGENDYGKRRLAQFSSTGARVGVVETSSRRFIQPATDNLLFLEAEAVRLVDPRREPIRILTRCPDHTWLVRPSRVAFARDGRMAIVSYRPELSDRKDEEETHATISLYQANGEPILAVRPSRAIGLDCQIAYDGHWLIIADHCELFLYNECGSLLHRLSSPKFAMNSHGITLHPFIRKNGSQVAVFDGSTGTLFYYELPHN